MKNIILIAFFFLVCGCGYTSIYKNLEDQDFQIIIIEMQGDREMNNLIKNEISLYSNKNSINKFEVKIKTEYLKSQLAKNSSGLITDYELSTNASFTVNLNKKTKELAFSESINIKNQTDTYEQNLYEKNVKRNFASSLREKLVSEIQIIK